MKKQKMVVKKEQKKDLTLDDIARICYRLGLTVKFELRPIYQQPKMEDHLL